MQAHYTLANDLIRLSFTYFTDYHYYKILDTSETLNTTLSMGIFAGIFAFFVLFRESLCFWKCQNSKTRKFFYISFTQHSPKISFYCKLSVWTVVQYMYYRLFLRKFVLESPKRETLFNKFRVSFGARNFLLAKCSALKVLF